MIKQYLLNPKEYIVGSFIKRAIALHFTAGWPNPYQTIDIWNKDNERKGTAFVIGGLSAKNPEYDGLILQAFPDDAAGYHLFRWFNGSEVIEKGTIGIEVCNWGPITKSGDKFLTYANTPIPASEVIELAMPFKGYKYWHKFSQKQLSSLEWLLNHLCGKYNIPWAGMPTWISVVETQSGDAVFVKDVQKMINVKLALAGKPMLTVDGVIGLKTKAAISQYPHIAFERHPDFKEWNKIPTGIFCHNTFDGDRKLDVHPDPNLIKMLSVH
jgi:hypothetical protein